MMAWLPEEPTPDLKTVTETATQSSTETEFITTTMSTLSTTVSTTTSTYTPTPEAIRELFYNFGELLFQASSNQTSEKMTEPSTTDLIQSTQIPNSTSGNFSDELSATVLRRNAVRGKSLSTYVIYFSVSNFCAFSI